jgi:hypothetical protein
MKKYFLLLLLLISSGSFAQGRMIGFDLGANFAGQSPKPDGGYNGTPGGMLGFEMGNYSPDDFSLRAQLFLEERARMGAAVNVNTINPPPQFSPHTYPLARHSEDCIELAVTLKHAVLGERFQSYVFAGPAIELDLAGNWTVEVGNEQQPFVNVALNGGIGFSYAPNPSRMYFIEVGYNYGLLDLSPPLSSQYYQQPFYSRDIRITSGILFGPK